MGLKVCGGDHGSDVKIRVLRRIAAPSLRSSRDSRWLLERRKINYKYPCRTEL